MANQGYQQQAAPPQQPVQKQPPQQQVRIVPEGSVIKGGGGRESIKQQVRIARLMPQVLAAHEKVNGLVNADGFRV